MRVNCSKTQAVCISASNGCHTFSVLRADGETILSAESMKLLGYVLGAEPGAAAHVNFLVAKFRAKFWSLINLNRAGVVGGQLYKLFCIFVRPTLEANAVIFHHMLTKQQENQLERLHRMVIRLCFGFNKPTEETRREMGILTLKERRDAAVMKFVAKTLTNPRFMDRWFRRMEEVDVELRRRQPFVENRALTTRYQKSPLVAMQKIANELHWMN